MATDWTVKDAAEGVPAPNLDPSDPNYVNDSISQVGTGLAGSLLGAIEGIGQFFAPEAKEAGILAATAKRCIKKIAKRAFFKSRKDAKEAAQRASPIGEAIAENNNNGHGPHYHPLDEKGNQTHDHYSFPEKK